MPEREAAELFGLTLAGPSEPQAAADHRRRARRSCASRVAIRDAEEVRDRLSDPRDSVGRARRLARPPSSAASARPRRRCPRASRALPAGVDELATEHLDREHGPAAPVDARRAARPARARRRGGHRRRGRRSATCTAASRSSPSTAATTRSARCWTAATTSPASTPSSRSRWPTEKLARDRGAAPRRSWLRVAARRAQPHREPPRVVRARSASTSGAMGPFLYVMRDRENAARHPRGRSPAQRMMFNYVRPGGVARRPHRRAPSRRSARSSTTFDELPRRARRRCSAATRSSRRACRGVGVIDRETRASRFGLTGANLRALGRRAATCAASVPYAAYDELDFDVPLAEDGDCCARYARAHGGDAPGGAHHPPVHRRHARGRASRPRCPRCCARRRARRTRPSSRRAASSASTSSPTAPTRRTGCASARRRSTRCRPARRCCPARCIADAVVHHRQPRHRARGDRPMNPWLISRPRACSRRSG